MNRDVESSGMEVTVGGPTFEVTMLENSKDGIFKDPYHELVHEEEALYWTMTPENNLINYNEPDEAADPAVPGDKGIHPGTEGVISFKVTPKVESINLDFNFEIIGYQALYNDVKNTPDDDSDDKLEMKKLSDLPDDEGIAAQNLINGHILLFGSRSGTAGNYTYSDSILSNADMQRVMNKTITGKDTPTQIDIYWVWPNTLSTLVDARSSAGITTTPFTSGTSYTKITENIGTYPHYYLKGVSSDTKIDVNNDIAAHYDIYGDMYDQGDNEIGMRVHYVLIKLSVTEGSETEENGETEENNETEDGQDNNGPEGSGGGE